MERYSKFFEDLKEINPIKDKSTDLNIMQLLALAIIETYKSGRADSFYQVFKWFPYKGYDKNEWKKEQGLYIDTLGEKASINELWAYIVNELFVKGYVDKRGSITLKGKQELEKLKKIYSNDPFFSFI